MKSENLNPIAINAAILLLIAAATLGGVWGGPALGDHEAIVAQCAREMRLSGDWLVPQFLDTPFIRKSPLPYWLVAVVSYLFPSDANTGLPVTDAAARLPSALAALGTVLLLWHLGSVMFGRRVGRVTAVISAASVFIMLYAPNATAEMLLTFCSTWAYVHFWHAVKGGDRRRRWIHLLLFYVALGMGMLAKGPSPIALTAFPLVVWWYVHRPLRLLAYGGPKAATRALRLGLREIGRRTLRAFRNLGVIPGTVIFAACFVPWMVAVAARHPHAWALWNWQYVQRAEGDYDDTRVRGVLYYLPIIIGYVLPWSFLIPEAVAAPWRQRHARYRKELLYVGLWTVFGLIAMSLMEFKKPYYIGPAVPGLLMLLAFSAERFFSHGPATARRGWWGWFALTVTLVALSVAGGMWSMKYIPEAAVSAILIAALLAGSVIVAGLGYRRGQGWHSLSLAAGSTVLAFLAAWYWCAPAGDTLEKVTALDRTLDEHGVPAEARVFWVDGRPDARLTFYYLRRCEHMLDPSEIVTRMVDRTKKKKEIEQMALQRAVELLSGAEPVYLIMDHKNYERFHELLPSQTRLLATVDSDPFSTAKDWTVLTNTAG